MTTTITSGATTITPTLVLGYDAETKSGNTIHELLGSAEPAVTFGTESLRIGSLEMFFLTRAAAWAAQAFLKSLVVFTLASTDESVIGMKFVREGEMKIGIDRETFTKWVVTFSYREVN